MIVDQINVDDVRSFELEDDSPVRGNRHAPEALQVPREGVQTKAGKIHIARRPRHIQIGENARDLLPMGATYPSLVVALVETLQSAMTEAPDHAAI